MPVLAYPLRLALQHCLQGLWSCPNMILRGRGRVKPSGSSDLSDTRYSLPAYSPLSLSRE